MCDTCKKAADEYYKETKPQRDKRDNAIHKVEKEYYDKIAPYNLKREKKVKMIEGQFYKEIRKEYKKLLEAKKNCNHPCVHCGKCRDM